MSVRIYGNRALQTLPGLTTRPTPSRVRQAVFNILQGQVAGSRWLDVCSGIGSMGAEALCRHCQSVIGIEQSAAACRVITANWTRLAQPDQSIRVLRGDVRRLLPGLTDLMDFVYFDPPYEGSLYDEVLPLFPRLLAPQGSVIVEHRSTLAFPPQMGSEDKTIEICDQRFYGETGLTFYQLKH